MAVRIIVTKYLRQRDSVGLGSGPLLELLISSELKSRPLPWLQMAPWSHVDVVECRTQFLSAVGTATGPHAKRPARGVRTGDSVTATWQHVPLDAS